MLCPNLNNACIDNSKRFLKLDTIFSTFCPNEGFWWGLAANLNNKYEIPNNKSHVYEIPSSKGQAYQV